MPGDELLSPVGKPYDTLEEVIGIRESAINIISGQFVLLVLKLGYFTNTTYGYIKWSKYIKQSKIEDKTLL